MRSPSRRPWASDAIAAGWSPVGSKGETTSNGVPPPSSPKRFSSPPNLSDGALEVMALHFAYALILNSPHKRLEGVDNVWADVAANQHLHDVITNL